MKDFTIFGAEKFHRSDEVFGDYATVDYHLNLR
jgi:hypothetical protein